MLYNWLNVTKYLHLEEKLSKCLAIKDKSSHYIKYFKDMLKHFVGLSVEEETFSVSGLKN